MQSEAEQVAEAAQQAQTLAEKLVLQKSMQQAMDEQEFAQIKARKEQELSELLRTAATCCRRGKPWRSWNSKW